MPTPDAIHTLVDRFRANLDSYKRGACDNETQVRREFVVGDVVRTQMAVQVKRWRRNVQAPIVQQVRGSLGTHEQGLIITTSDFSKGAREEAARPNAVPVGLMNGEQLVALLVENNIGIQRTSYQLIELGDHVRAAAEQTSHVKTVLQRQIKATDQQIDALVYALYGLTEGEVAVVEGRG